MPREVRIVHDAKDIVGESAVWDAARQRLVWVDIIGRRIAALDPATGAVQRWSTPEPVTSIGLCADGRAVVGFLKRVAIWDWNGAFETLAEVEPDQPGTRLNEGVVAPTGDFWVGTMAQNFDEDGAPMEMAGHIGRLYRVTPSGKVHPLTEDRFGITNTLVWPSPDRLVTADTLANTLYTYRIENNSLTGRKTLLSDYPRGIPDGSCPDAEGHVWNCRVAGGGCVIRIAPDGSISDRIDLPCSSPTSCAFGGPDMATLFVTSARFGMDDAHLNAHSHEGAVMAVEPGVSGLPANLFGV